MGSHSNTLAWKIPRTEEPDRLQFMRSKKNQTGLGDLAQRAGEHVSNWLCSCAEDGCEAGR